MCFMLTYDAKLCQVGDFMERIIVELPKLFWEVTRDYTIVHEWWEHEKHVINLIIVGTAMFSKLKSEIKQF